MTSIRLAGMMVDSDGEGPPIVMLHGLGGTSNSFQTMVTPLANFRIVRPDLPGAGRSPLPAQQLTVRFLVEASGRAMSWLISSTGCAGKSSATSTIICSAIQPAGSF